MKSKLPRHLAIIMDGNGRWARLRGLPRVEGHRAGARAAKEIIEYCAELPIPYLSLFAFSTDNWQRPRYEIDALFALMEEYLVKEKARLVQNGIRFLHLGSREGLPRSLLEKIDEVTEATKANQRMHLLVGVNFSGQWEILQAVRALARAVADGQLKPEEIDLPVFRRYLPSGAFPEPDFLIRTSGEYRLSNFYLFQIAYTELYTTPVLWPDFKREDLDRALQNFARRERRFGRVSQPQKA